MSFVLSKQTCSVAALCLFQLALTAAAFGPDEWPIGGRIVFMLGLGDSQIALAMILAAWPSLRWSLRWPIACMTFISGWACHYVCWIALSYPFLCVEQVLTSLFQAMFVLGFLVIARQIRGLSLSHEADAVRPAAETGMRLPLRDALVWIALAAVLTSIGKRAMALTDVSGMSDPWEDAEFFILTAPDWAVARLPLLLLSLLLCGAVWSEIATRTLSAADNWYRLFVAIGLLFLGLSVGELAVSFGVLLFDKPWPWLPIGMDPAILLVLHLDSIFVDGRPEFISEAVEDCWELLLLLICRTAIFCASLLLLRRAGFRLPRDASLPLGVQNNWTNRR